MERKLVIFDVDGTLITRDNVLPAGVWEALVALKQKGHVAVFFTGRPYTHVVPAVRELDWDGCICTMGAYLQLEGKVVQNLLPDPAAVQELVRLIRVCDLEAVFESDEGIRFDETRPLSEFLCKLKANFEQRGFETEKGVEQESFSFSKLCVWSRENSNMVRFEKEASAYLKVIGKKQNMMELVSNGASIEGSVQRLMSYFQIPREDCYAIGDSINDLPMLRCAAHAAAMGEASGELKEQVEFVTSGIEENGLVNFLRHYRLI